MAVELFLNFLNERNARQRAAVSVSPFSIGRTPENNLAIPNGALSRRHARIERFADVFILTDEGSSNGTMVNGVELFEPVAIKNGDKIVFGGAVEVGVEIVGEPTGYEYHFENQAQVQSSESFSPVESVNAPFWQNIFFIAPICGVCALLVTGILIFALSPKEPPVIAQNNREIEEPPIRESNRRVANEDIEEPVVNSNRKSNENSSNSSVNSNSEANVTPSVNPATAEQEKVEKYALQFLRNISADTKPVLTSGQISAINAKIKSFRGSANLRENLNVARKTSGSFQAASQSTGLKPAFIAAFGLAKLNQSRGDAGGAANPALPLLEKLSVVLGTELANDSLLIVAAHEEGGSHLAMRDKLANLAAKTENASSATVRSIWFLKENGKVAEPAYEFVLRFLAVGTIAQNPKEFGIDAEPLNF